MQTILLSAADAAINGALILMDTPLAHTIHYWNNTTDTISWEVNVSRPGRYLVKLNYSLDKNLPGGLIKVSIASKSLTFEAGTTDSWLDFEEFEAGEIDIDEVGTVSLELKGLKLPIAEQSAFPDIHTVSLVAIEG